MNEGASSLADLTAALTTQINAAKGPILDVAVAAAIIFGLFIGIRYMVRSAKTVK